MSNSSAQAVDGTAPRSLTFRASLVRTPEGQVLLLGLGLTLLYLVLIPLSGLLFRVEAHVLLVMTAMEIVVGRAAALTWGYSSDLHNAIVILVVMMLETILVFLFYPLFVFSCSSLVVIKRLRATFLRIHSAAEAHKDRVQRYGVIGLFLFVWLPFWMTGPVVGCVIGFLLGLRTWVNMATVLASTYAAILGWAFFLREFEEQLQVYGRYAGIIVVIAVGLFFFFLQRVHRRINGKKNNRKNTVEG